MKTKNLILILLLIGMSLILNCQKKDSETGYPITKEDQVLIIEPNLTQCNCFKGQECLVMNGESSCEAVRGFKHTEGTWVKILANMYERPSGIQDVGKFGYIFTKQVDKINNSDNPTLKELCVFYGGQWDERANQACAITNTHLQKKYCEHADPKSTSICRF